MSIASPSKSYFILGGGENMSRVGKKGEGERENLQVDFLQSAEPGIGQA